MDVVGYDPHIRSFPAGVEPVSLEDVFRRSHFISVHVHLTPETTKLISAERLTLARRGVVVINTSRGQVIDESALLEGLQSGHVGAAGLDVLTNEPDIDNDPLVAYARTHDNLLITPHCGGYSPDAVRVVCAHSARTILNVLTSASNVAV
jgi:D-3-phosphoglycerate dehydrogenase